MDNVIELNNVVAVLGGFPALAGVSLSVQRGEIVLLQGPNGAGINICPSCVRWFVAY